MIKVVTNSIFCVKDASFCVFLSVFCCTFLASLNVFLCVWLCRVLCVTSISFHVMQPKLSSFVRDTNNNIFGVESLTKDHILQDLCDSSVAASVYSVFICFWLSRKNIFAFIA